MKINGITVSNFLGLPSFKHRLAERVLFIGGGNGAGKTSLLEAVRFALTGATPRGITKVGDRPELITEGATTGYAQVDAAGTSYRRGITTGKLNGGDKDELPASIAFCLDSTRFAQLPEAERRKMLFSLAGVKVDKETVAEQLRLHDVPQHAIDSILPKLAGGFSPAAAYAKEQASQARGAWKAITGEKYGSQKADGWAAEATGEAPTDEEIEAERAAIAKCEARIEELAAAQGRANAYISDEKREELQRHADDHDQCVQELETAQARYDAASAQVAEVEGAARGTVAPTCNCPECGATLRVTATGVAIASDDGGAQRPSAAERNAAKAVAHDAYTELQACRGALARSEAAIQILANLPPPPSTDDMRAGPRLEEARQQAHAHRDWLRALEQRAREHADAHTITEKAAGYHASVAGWVAAERALGPDGIPAILLSKALDPINAMLSDLAKKAGWQPAAISRELVLTFGGRAYNLVSESEQWRADALFSAAIAILSGVGVLALDRFDVLEPAARGEAIDWICSLAYDSDTIDTVIVAGTLKAKPDLGEGVDVVWLGDSDA